MSVETKIDGLCEAVGEMRKEISDSSAAIQVIEERTGRMDRDVDHRFAAVNKRIDDARQDAVSAGRRSGAGVSVPVAALTVVWSSVKGWFGFP
jgi:hypothetical protein